MIVFKKYEDPLKSLGIGQKQIIKNWLDEMEIENYKINEDYTINVSGILNLHMKGLDKIPDFINFNKVNNSFSCSYNNLTSLRGCPKYVGWDFYCKGNSKQFTKRDVIKICKVKGIIIN